MGDIKWPFNASDRERVGLSAEFYEELKGEMRDEREMVDLQSAKITIGYDAA